MSDSSQWHYTDKAGQQLGPVTTDALIQLILTQAVPTSAMAWKDGMSGWKPVSQIEELQAAPSASAPLAATAPTPPKPQAAAKPNTINPYESPQIPNTEEKFSYEASGYGGIGRLAYFLISLIVSVAINVAQFALGGNEAEPLVLYGLPLLSIIISFSLIFSRFKNIGMTRWWTLGLFVPILNIFVSIWLISRQEGWIETRQLDKAGKIVAWVFGIFITLFLVAAIAAVFFFATTAYQEASKKTELKQKSQQQQTQQLPR